MPYGGRTYEFVHVNACIRGPLVSAASAKLSRSLVGTAIIQTPSRVSRSSERSSVLSLSTFRDVLMGGGYVCMFQKPFLGCINPHICKFNCFVLIFLSSGHSKIQPRTPISSALFSKTHSFELGELSAYRCDSARCYSSSFHADASHKQ